MTAWMLLRGMPRRPVAEMSATMPILAVLLLGLGWLGILPMGNLALLEHGLMMPVMLLPMVARLDLYTGRASHTMSPSVRCCHSATIVSTRGMAQRKRFSSHV